MTDAVSNSTISIGVSLPDPEEPGTTRLDIGAGNTRIEGMIPWDIKTGQAAYPLPHEDGSVADIRCSHMLEHLTYGQAQDALTDWFRVLRPGGRLRLSVPDWDKLRCLDLDNNEQRFWITGGQTDEYDIHKSQYSESMLACLLRQIGYVEMRRWVTDHKDTSTLPISLNVECFKPMRETEKQLKVAAIMSIPRIGWNAAWGQIISTLNAFNIPLRACEGVFWGQCMQRTMEECVRDGIDLILTIDYDSMPTKHALQELFRQFLGNPEIDALAALQMRREQKFPLFAIKPEDADKLRPKEDVGPKQDGVKTLVIDGNPIKVETAHFGLTLIKVEALKKCGKPWFASTPDKEGGWGDLRVDDDIFFWNQWREAGNSCYMAPTVSIGHLELKVSQFDENMNPLVLSLKEWRERFNQPAETTND